MFAKRYNADELIDIIAAPAYSPELIEYVKKVANAPYLSQFLSQKPKLGITGTIAKDYVSADTKDAVPYVSTKQVKGLHAYMDDAKYISKEADIEWAKCRVEDGDIIINKSGNVGAAAVLCCAPYKYVNSVSDIINIKLDKTASIDRDFLVVFLNSPYGQKQLQRLSGGAIFSHVSLHAIPDIRVYHPDIKAQKYIADKVRQAEQLRTWAKRLENQFHQKLTENYPEAFEDKRTGKKHSKAPVDDISYTLNPGAFDEERLRIRLYLKKLGAVKLSEIATIEGPTCSSYSPQTKYIGLDSISSNSCALSPSTIRESDVTGTSRLLSEGPVVAKLRPYLNKVSYIPKSFAGAVGSTELLCVKATGATSNWYLYGVLKSDITLQQLKPVASGSTHPRIDQYDLYDLVLPIHQDHQIIGSWIENAQLAYFAAAQQVNAAKTLVEALIEGQLTERQLIEAQQALEDGDNRLDQAILSKLSAEGYAIEGATPLFSDVDELYSLLEEAAQAEAEE